MPRNGDGIYTRKDRPGYWISFKDAHGRRRRRKVEASNRTKASELRGGFVTQERIAEALGVRPAGPESFEQVAKQYLAHQKIRISAENYVRERGIVEDHLKPFFAGSMKAIHKGMVARYVTERCAEASNGTVTKELNVLKHLLRLAAEQWEYIPMNPAQGVKAPKNPPGRLRYLQPGELRALLEMAPSWLRPIIALAAATGMRRSEILHLRWLDLDIRGARILLPETKNGDARIVYLNQLALSALKSLPLSTETKATDRIFRNIKPRRVSVRFLRLCRQLNILDFRLHDLRHTAASWLRMSGADIHTVAQLLGHKTLRMAARYQHLSPQFLAEAVGKLDTTFKECHPYVTVEKLLEKGEEAND